MKEGGWPFSSWCGTSKILCSSRGTVCPHVWSQHTAQTQQQVSEQSVGGGFSLCSCLGIVGTRPAVPPVSAPPSSVSPPPNQSALHLPSLRACHSYGISEGRRPLPLSPLLLLTPLSSRPYFRAHFATEFSEGSRWHLALLSSHSEDRRQRSSADRTKNKKTTWKWGLRIYSLSHPAWSLQCFLCPQACCCCSCCCCYCWCWFPYLSFIWVAVAVLATKKKKGWDVNPRQTLELSWLLALLTGPWYVSYAHTLAKIHTHTYTSMHKHAAECFSQSSLPPRLPAASKELGIQRDLPETYSYIHTDTQRI